MEQRRVGRSGLMVSAMALGCNNFNLRIDFDAAQAVVDRALDLGITMFDTADIYGRHGGSEAFLGRALGSRRQRVVVATKSGLPSPDLGDAGNSRRRIVAAVEASLRRLGTDWIDLYHLHHYDPDTPIEESLRALDDLVRAGKIRYCGCSNFSAWQLADAAWTARHHGLNGFVCCQDEYNLLARRHERDLMPAAQAFGLGFMAYLPLAGGLLTGKYSAAGGAPEGSRFANAGERRQAMLNISNLAMVDRIAALATSYDMSVLELGLGWLAKSACASIVVGATSPAQLDINVAAFRTPIPDELAARLDTLISDTPEI